ncbi:MAG: hypothetical protein IPG50_07045 [Myxococcales bacterium]|nr:hypothetical protein [Myxococcales bacterium]
MNRPRTLLFTLGVVLPVAVPLVSCTDPVQDKAIAALGPEIGTPGPDHRPGQPCVTCHSEFGNSSSIFSVGGTIYESAGSPQGAANVSVLMRSADNSSFTATTGPSGNFFVRKNEWDPAFPLLVHIYRQDVGIRPMLSHVGREPSCAGCHFNPPDAGFAADARPLVHYTAFQSVGQVYLK